MDLDMDDIFDRLAKSDFRSRFKLKDKDKLYIKEKGLDTIRRHAEDFIAKRIGTCCKYLRPGRYCSPLIGIIQ